MNECSSFQYARQAKIDKICLEFEDAWQRGERPSLYQYWLKAEDDDREALLAALIEVELVYRRRQGESPRPEDYLTLFPDYPQAVSEAFACRTYVDCPAGPLEPGTRLGRYRVVKRLGQGAFGAVYLAEDEELGRPVAVKLPGNDVGFTRCQVDRLLEEIRSAARLHHPSIVAIYDVQRLRDGRLFAVMEYVAGGTLRQFMAEKRSFPSWARFFATLAEALAYAHAQGFIHRDLDPDNVLVDSQGQPHVTDFGLAVHEDQQSARRGERAGSWAYMAPEQVRGETHLLDGRADLWAVGVMLYECLTGRRPFRGDSLEELLEQILHREPKPLRQICPEIPAALESICLKCLRKDPAQRWASAAELAEALHRFARSTGRGMSRRTMLAGLSAAGLAVGAASWFIGRHVVSRQPPATLHTELLVWRRSQWYSVRQAWVLPLRNGDLIRIEIQCHPAQWLYVMWRDLAGVTTPLYPWRDGRWTERTPEQAREKLRIPSERLDFGLPIQLSTVGHEWLLVGCRPHRLKNGVALGDILSGIPPLHLPNDVAVGLSLDRAEYLVQPRGVEANAPVHIPDPVLAFQTALSECCKRHFTAIQCLALPVAP